MSEIAEKGEPAGFATLRERIETWRRTRLKPGAMPEELWQAAARLAAKHGINPTAEALRLQYYCSAPRCRRRPDPRYRRDSCVSQFRPQTAPEVGGKPLQLAVLFEVGPVIGRGRSIVRGREPARLVGRAAVGVPVPRSLLTYGCGNRERGTRAQAAGSARAQPSGRRTI